MVRMGEIAFSWSVAVYQLPVCVDFYTKNTTSAATAMRCNAYLLQFVTVS